MEGDQLLRDSAELGRRISAARGYHQSQRPEFAELIGTSDTTLLRWERGEFSSTYRTIDQRRQLMERVARASGCPPGWLGLAQLEPSTDDRLREVEAIVRELRVKAFGETAVQLEEDEERTARQYRSSGQHSEEPGRGAASE